MVMNMRRFVRDEQGRPAPQRLSRLAPRRWRPRQQLTSIARFEQLRGSQAYIAFLRQLRPQKWFEPDADEARVEVAGHALGVFRQYLIEHSFFPTYRLTEPTRALADDALEADPTLAERLAGWSFKVRLTRHGLVTVKLERQLQDMLLTDISRLILEIQQTPFDETARLPTQWQLAMDIVARFVEACGCQFVVPNGGDQSNQQTIGKPTVVALEPRYPAKRLPLHDRHITYVFTGISDGSAAVSASTLVRQHAGEIIGLLENAILMQDGSFSYPDYKETQFTRIADLDIASWRNELCLITSEATFIFCPFAADSAVFISGSTRVGGTTFYGDYWKSIARGIEHVVVLKNEVQLLERETTKLLETIPEITRKAADGHLSRSDRQEILNLATGVSRLFQALPQQRDALVPSSVFRASYATRKFKWLMDLLGIYEIERHIETNVQELNAFLAHFNGIQLQYDERRTNLIFSTLTVIFSILVVPSFLADLKQIEWVNQSDLDRVPHAFHQLSEWIGLNGLLSSSRLLGVLGLIWLAVLILVWRARTGRHY
jgi:hypothetical protein